MPEDLDVLDEVAQDSNRFAESYFKMKTADKTAEKGDCLMSLEEIGRSGEPSGKRLGKQYSVTILE